MLQTKYIIIIVVVVVIVIVLAIVLPLVLLTGGTTNPPANFTPVSDTLALTNKTSHNPLRISLQITSDQNGDVWVKLGGGGTLSSPTYADKTQNPPNYQIVRLNINETIYVGMPKFQPWRVTPLSDSQGGMPTLIECGKNMVCDMSAVDGVNYLCEMTLTAMSDGKGTVSTINFSQSPCSTPGIGCTNPSVDGQFLSGTTYQSAPCPQGTCNLTGDSFNWAQAIHTGQCANGNNADPDSSHWGQDQRAPNCNTSPPGYTTYSYSHDDQNSSPTLFSPFLVTAIFRDLN